MGRVYVAGCINTGCGGDGQPVRSAFAYANIAASICVERMGAPPPMPTAEEVSAFLRSLKPAPLSDRS
jgi:sugar/nucleoside kinase (ribokinase family)